MKNNTAESDTLGYVALVFLIVFIVTISSCMTSIILNSGWRKAAIEHGAAYHDSITAEFKWKVKDEDNKNIEN